MALVGIWIWILQHRARVSIPVRLLSTPEFKVRFNGGWDYNLGLASGAEFALDTEIALAPDGGNLKVAEAGDYTITLNLAKSPCTMTVSKK